MRKIQSKINYKSVFIAILFVLIFIFVALFFRANNFYTKIYTGGFLPQINKEPKTAYNILLMGYGGGRHEGTYLTDTMMVAHVDTKIKKILLISIPRDVWVPVPTRNKNEIFHSKINSVYQMGLSPSFYPNIEKKYQSTQGSAELLKTILKRVTGLDIDYYIALDFEGFTRAVDLLDGVDVMVEKTFDDYKYPVDGMERDPCGKMGEELVIAEKEATEEPELIFPCRYEHLHFNKGLKHMDGELALKYVRSRNSAEEIGDFSRARRQQLFLEALRKKVLNLGIITKVVPLMDELENHIRLDITKNRIQEFIKEGDNAGEYNITHVVLSTDNFLKNSYSEDRQYILIPKLGIDVWRDVRHEIQNSIKGISPILSPAKIQ